MPRGIYDRKARSTAATRSTSADVARHTPVTSTKGHANGSGAKTPTNESAEPAPLELSARLRNRIDKIRSPFKGYIAEFNVLQVSRADLCESFMETYTRFKEETERDFPTFVRQFDATIGPARADYREHKTYMAADYLRRLYNQRHPKAAPTAAKGQPARPKATPREAMARTLAAILPLISADQVDKLWETVTRETGWSDRQITDLKDEVGKSDPLLAVRAPRGSGQGAPQLMVAVPRHTHASEQREDAAAAA